MGNDYEQRKQSKKRRRTEIDSEIASEGGSKHKKKRAAIRRICKGMCYNEPQLTVEDQQWEGDASDEEEAPVRERRLAQAAITELNREKEVQKAKREAAKAQRSRKRLSNGPRMSTAVALIEPREDAAEAAERPQLGEAERDALGEAMRQFPDSMQRYMLEERLAEPMPIQQRCWPLCLEGRDLMATAEPGSGKTLGYLLPAVPLLQRLGHSSESQPDGPAALVLVPTRELAQQVATVGRTFRKLFGLRTLAIIGGADKDAQVHGLAKKPHIVVATPGRLLDLLEEGHLSLDCVRYVVLDEADKMLGLGLQPQLERLRKLLLPLKRQAGQQLPGPVRAQPSARKRPQVVMVSATSTEEAGAVAAKWMRRAVRVHTGMTAANISRSVVQTVHVCAEHKKPQKLLKHLQQIKEQGGALRNPPRVLIFANHIKTVRFLHQTVAAAGFRTAMLHGERSQPEREEAMRDFRSGKAQVLVATDVAARGLHIRGLPFVINYDFPGNLESYIHRAGRTGRLAADGHCYSFFTRNLAPLAAPLLALLQEHDQAVDPNLLQLAEAYRIAAGKLQGSPASGDDRDGGAATAAVAGLDGSCAGKAVEDLELLADLFGGGAPSAEKAVSLTAAEDAAEDSAVKESCHPADELAHPEIGEGTQNEPRTQQAAVAGRKRKRQALPGRLRKKLASDRSAKAKRTAI